MSATISSTVLALLNPVWDTYSKAMSNPRYATLRDIVFIWILLKGSSGLVQDIRIHGIFGYIEHCFKKFTSHLVKSARNFVPGANDLVKKEIAKSIASIEKKVAPDVPGEKKYLQLPSAPLSSSELHNELTRYQKMASDDWKKGRVSGAIYHDFTELNKCVLETYGAFSLSNPLHPELFPGVRKMESEVIAMVLNMFHAPPGAAGSVTSGGTESLLMAIKTYRDMAQAQRGVTTPNMVIPNTIHAAVNKAAEYFKIELILVPVDPVTFKVDLKKMAAAINGNTIMIAGSAPNYPHGIIDDIPGLSKLALERNLPLHVDCCLGSFLVPYMGKAGFSLPHSVDFELPGVTSISCDTHKYGFAPKGTSVIMYRTKALRRFQYFVATEWPGGVYASPSAAGSRPGGLVACCWATMLKMGEQGYIQSAHDIISCARKLKNAIKNDIPQLKLIGDPLISVIAFDSADSKIQIYGVADLLNQRGWHLSVLQFPKCIHLACTMLTVSGMDDLIQDLKEIIQILILNPNAGNSDISAIYGTAASVPDRSIIAEVCEGFLDALTKA